MKLCIVGDKKEYKRGPLKERTRNRRRKGAVKKINTEQKDWNKSRKES